MDIAAVIEPNSATNRCETLARIRGITNGVKKKRLAEIAGAKEAAVIVDC